MLLREWLEMSKTESGQTALITVMLLCLGYVINNDQVITNMQRRYIICVLKQDVLIIDDNKNLKIYVEYKQVPLKVSSQL